MRRIALFSVALTLLYGSDADRLAGFSKNFARLFAQKTAAPLLKAKLVKFPLVLKGTLDDSPEIRISKKKFAVLFTRLTHQPSGMSTTNLKETESEYISAQLAKGKFPEEAGEGTLRWGNLVFAKSGAGWRLIQIYVEDSLIADIQK
jgi:hypothetical protein